MLTLMPSAISCFDGRDAGGGRRHLDHQVRPVDRLPQPARVPHGRLGVVRDGGGHLEAHVAVRADGAVVHRPQDGAGRADVVHGQGFEEAVVVDAGPGREHLTHLGVVVGTARNGLLEDGRVARDTRHAILLDEAAQPAALEQAPTDVVDPDRLTGTAEFEQRIHGFSRCHLSIGQLTTCQLTLVAPGSGRVFHRAAAGEALILQVARRGARRTWTPGVLRPDEPPLHPSAKCRVQSAKCGSARAVCPRHSAMVASWLARQGSARLAPPVGHSNKTGLWTAGIPATVLRAHPDERGNAGVSVSSGRSTEVARLTGRVQHFHPSFPVNPVATRRQHSYDTSSHHHRRQRGGRLGRPPDERGHRHLPDHPVLHHGRVGGRVVGAGPQEHLGHRARRSSRCSRRAAPPAPSTARCRPAR